MARIKKDDHARILQMVDVERRAVREIATEFGCTAANIYSLLAKLRRGGSESGAGAMMADGTAEQPLAAAPLPGLGLEPSLPPPDDPTENAIDTAMPDLMPVPAKREPLPPDMPAAARLAIVPRAVPQASPASPLPAPQTAAPDRRPVIGARLSKPGMGLVMRTEDGEETMTPFRSIDDLLSAIKPILRASARSTDAVWFSLQPVDLSAIEVDAA